MGLEQYLKLDRLADGRVLAVTLARQDNDKNQLNVPLVGALKEAFDIALNEPGLKGLVLRSSHDRVFSTGADIAGEMTGLNATQAQEFSRHGHSVFGKLTTLPCPTVACVAGFCLGGGLELALCCDFRIAAKNARMGLPEINLGLIPGWGGTQRLQLLVGRSRALRMVFSGDPVNADAALECGLVDEVVETPAELEGAALALLQRFSNKAGRTVGLAKQAIYATDAGELESGLATESLLFGTAWDTPQRLEGISAFLEKRRPNWPED